MAIENRLSSFLNSKKWVIPVLFGFMVFFVISTITIVEIRGFEKLANNFAFSIGGELCAMIIATVIALSILPAYKRQSGYVRIFVTLLAIGCFSLFLDTVQMVVDGIPELATLNKVVCVFVFSNEIVFLFFFWIFVTHALKSKGNAILTINLIASIGLLVFALLPFVNFFYPLYFSIPDTGIYQRSRSTWWICRIFFVMIVIFTIIALVLSKEPKKKKIVIIVFMSLPIVSMGAGGYQYGVSLLYTSMMVSLLLMYAVLYSDNEKNLYSTGKELGLATNIQKQMLPSIFPAFPERKEFDVYATMNPAKEVGGDFYDFFLIDEDHLGLVMADVSDKGVPAALFMMASKIMVQNYAMLGLSPKDVLYRVNNQICSNNQQEMFVTIWFGILDIKTGTIVASNGGHERPIVKSPNGHFEILNDKHNLVVGFIKNTAYSEYTIQLEKGSKLFIYTDGVPEASNSHYQFGMNRTLEAIRKYEDDTPYDILHGVYKDVTKFMGDTTQFDDITMLCLEYLGKDNTVNRVEIPAKIESIKEAINPIIKMLNDAQADSKTVYKIELSLDELLTNIASYAYKDNEEGTIIVEYELNKENEIAISVIDEGVEFNPLDAKDPDIEAALKDRKVGGLGLFIVKKTMDSITYHRDNNKNVLTLRKKL